MSLRFYAAPVTSNLPALLPLAAAGAVNLTVLVSETCQNQMNNVQSILEIAVSMKTVSFSAAIAAL